MPLTFGRWPLLLVLLPLLGVPVMGRAGEAEVCERAIALGALRENVPADVLQAISLTETGRLDGGRLRPWPWAVNREGKGYWFRTREEALAFARKSAAEGRRSFDLGCFQINYLWHGENFPSIEAMLDPEAGARYAARFLRSLYGERGDWSAAAGAYHSLTPALANVYRARFDRIRAGIEGTPLPQLAEIPAPEEPRRPKRSRTRLARGPKIITLPPVTLPRDPAREAALSKAAPAAGTVTDS